MTHLNKFQIEITYRICLQMAGFLFEDIYFKTLATKLSNRWIHHINTTVLEDNFQFKMGDNFP